MIKIEIKSVFGKVLFAYENEEATIKDAVLEALKRGVDLSGSDLRGSDLSNSNLRNSNLSNSNLRGSDLSNSNLRNSNLSNSNLRGSNLSGSNLSGSDLRGSDLSNSNLSNSNLRNSDLRGSDLSNSNLSGSDLSGSVKVPLFCKWTFGVTDNFIHIGCEKRSVDDWKKFLDSDEVISTPRDSEDFKQIVKVIKAMIAYSEG